MLPPGAVSLGPGARGASFPALRTTHRAAFARRAQDSRKAVACGRATRARYSSAHVRPFRPDAPAFLTPKLHSEQGLSDSACRMSRFCHVFRIQRAKEALLPLKNTGGRGGIRTHGGLSATAVFKTASINHSDTLPCGTRQRLPSRHRRKQTQSKIDAAPIHLIRPIASVYDLIFSACISTLRSALLKHPPF